MLHSLHVCAFAVLVFMLALHNDGHARMRGTQGSPAYCAPEVRDGKYNAKVDVYSLGVIVYGMHHTCTRTTRPPTPQIRTALLSYGVTPADYTARCTLHPVATRPRVPEMFHGYTPAKKAKGGAGTLTKPHVPREARDMIRRMVERNAAQRWGPREVCDPHTNVFLFGSPSPHTPANTPSSTSTTTSTNAHTTPHSVAGPAPATTPVKSQPEAQQQRVDAQRAERCIGAMSSIVQWLLRVPNDTVQVHTRLDASMYSAITTVDRSASRIALHMCVCAMQLLKVCITHSGASAEERGVLEGVYRGVMTHAAECRGRVSGGVRSESAAERLSMYRLVCSIAMKAARRAALKELLG